MGEETATAPSARRRRVTIAALALGLLVGGWLLRYTLLLDFPRYVEELQAERNAELVAAMNEAVADIMAGDGEAAVASAEALRDEDPDWEAEQLSDEDVERLADAFAEVGLVDLRGWFSFLSLAVLERDDALAQCRDALGHLGARSGPHARLVLWLNAHRCDALVEHWREALREAADEERDRLTPAQRQVIEDAVGRYGVAVRGSLLRLHSRLGVERARVTHRRIAEALAERPPTEMTQDTLAERIYALEDDHDLGGCTVDHDLEAERYVSLHLDCYDMEDDEDEPLDPQRSTLYVDLVEGRVLDALPPALAEAWESEGEEAVTELARRLREATSPEGELPDDEQAAPFLDVAMDRSACIVTYEPLGYYEEADLRAVCPNRSFTVHVVAAAATGDAEPATQ